MLLNYIKIAWRNIARHKVYSLVNVLGLAMGICACVVLYLIVQYEFSFDRFHPDGDRIYRIVGERQNESGEKQFINSVYDDVAPFETQIPGFTVRAGYYHFDFNIEVPDEKGKLTAFDNRLPGADMPNAILTKPSYFDIFSRRWLEGSARVLDAPFQVVLTESRARLYFGNIPLRDMIGRQVIYADSLKVNVAGIVADWTQHTDFAYTDFVSPSTATHSFLKQRIPTEDWSSFHPHGTEVFVKLDKGTTAAEVNARFARYIQTHLHYKHGKVTMYLQPLSSVHFSLDFHQGDDGDGWRKPYLPILYTLMGVAAFILLLAIINFINLSTAQSIQRAREIGVRKVLGGSKGDIMGQFLTETLVMTLFAVLLSVCLVRPILSLFSNYVPDGVVFHPGSPATLAFLGGVTLCTTLLAGFYPARVLAAYLPVLTLKGTSLQTTGGHALLRKALIVFQFVISLVFIIGALVISKQIHFMRTTDKGFNPDAVITMSNWGSSPEKLKAVASGIAEIPGVSKVLLQGHAPMGFAQSMSTFIYKGKDSMQLNAMTEMGDDGFIPFYQIRLIAGRNLLHSDSLRELVVNEAMTRAFGFLRPQDALGKYIYMPGPKGEKSYPIVGVVADFHMESFHEVIKPTVILNRIEWKKSVAVRLSPSLTKPGDVKVVLARIEAEWKKVYPNTPFDYSFLNESLTWLFAQEESTAWLAGAAMCITISISCMGLFGLALFSARRRIKEIGIRKVLGARATQIVILLNRDFVILVSVALVIASPLAYYLSYRWLQDFVYRTSVSWWIFVVAGASALGIALATVTFQAVKAALANPVKSLRTE